jgi:hypothetical protein
MEEKSNPAKSIFKRMQTLFLQLPDRLIFFLLDHNYFWRNNNKSANAFLKINERRQLGF